MAAVEIVHELSTRMRVRCSYFLKPGFDPTYLEALIANIPGVEQVRINTLAASIVVLYDGKPETKKKVLALLKRPPGEAFLPEDRISRSVNPFTLLFLGVNALLIRFFPRPLKYLISFMVAIPTITRGVLALFTKGLKVEVLDAAVVIFSLMRKDFFTSNAVIFLLELGDYLEYLSEERSSDLLKDLLKPKIEKAWIEVDGREVSVPAGEIRPGNIVVCGPGDMLPVDGEVVSGDALVDESSVTGESRPVHVSQGAQVLSGVVVTEGKIKIRAERAGSDTTMARINRYLEQSLRSKSPSQKRSEKMADSLVPVTFTLGAGIYLLTGDPSRAASVLTVDYSCAIKLINPVTLKTYMYSAAKGGVLLKGAMAMEGLTEVDTMIFDKTGTLTQGRFEVVEIVPAISFSADEILALAAGAEQHYTHPIAKAVVASAASRGLELPAMSQVDFVVAHGVSAYVGDRRILVGSRHFIEDDEGIDCSSVSIKDALRRLGGSLLYVAVDNRLAGVIVLRDAIRPEAPAVLIRLKQLGIKRIVVLTGDQQNAAQALKDVMPEIDEIRWGLKPEDKAALIKEMEKSGCRTAFVGDGVNDAPALVTSTVGICMPGGSELARSAAQIILLKEDLRGLVLAREAAMSCSSTLRKGFYATVGLNTLYLLGAVTGRISPISSAMLHNSTTVGTLAYCSLSGLSFKGKEQA